jgi:hypothetical protein
VLQGATQLQELGLYLKVDPSSCMDQLVLGLQEALPALSCLRLLSGQQGLAANTLAELRPGLWVGPFF